MSFARYFHKRGCDRRSIYMKKALIPLNLALLLVFLIGCKSPFPQKADDYTVSYFTGDVFNKVLVEFKMKESFVDDYLEFKDDIELYARMTGVGGDFDAACGLMDEETRETKCAVIDTIDAFKDAGNEFEIRIYAEMDADTCVEYLEGEEPDPDLADDLAVVCENGWIFDTPKLKVKKMNIVLIDPEIIAGLLSPEISKGGIKFVGENAKDISPDLSGTIDVDGDEIPGPNIETAEAEGNTIGGEYEIEEDIDEDAGLDEGNSLESGSWMGCSLSTSAAANPASIIMIAFSLAPLIGIRRKKTG